MVAVQVWSFVNGGWKPGDLAFADCRWFDLEAPPDGELETLGERFHLHHLAIEDCRSTRLHAPKVDDFGAYLFIVMHVPAASSAEFVEMEELDIFLAPGTLITYRDRAVREVGHVHEMLQNGMTMRPGTDGLLYEIMDRAVDALLPEVEAIGNRLDELHDLVLEDPGDTRSHDIVSLRAHAGRVRRLLTPQLAVVQRLSRGEFPQVDEHNRVYFRDIYDHLVRIDLALENLREDAEVVLSTYLAQVNNRMSEVMKVLSVVAAIALPATVISGIFGTNFDNVPGLHSNWGFALMMSAMGGLMGGMALFFKRRGWW